MDALKGFLLWPLVNIFAYLRFITGLVIVLIPYVLQIATKGRKSMSKHLDLFKFVQKYPLGLSVFSGVIGFYSPYTASIHPQIKHLSPSECVATMPDLPWLRNPFQCLHAVALTNLGECVAGICLVSLFQIDKRYKGIPVRITTEFYKKARGEITGKATVSLEVGRVRYSFAIL